MTLGKTESSEPEKGRQQDDESRRAAGLLMSKLWSVVILRSGGGTQKRRWQCGGKIGVGFGQGHDACHIQVCGSRSRRKPGAVPVNGILPGVGNSAGLAKKGERCPQSRTAVPKRAQAEVAKNAVVGRMFPPARAGGRWRTIRRYRQDPPSGGDRPSDGRKPQG